MGLILDSSVLIATERQGQNAHQMLALVSREIGETPIGLSVVTLIELAHGAARAGTPERRAKREQFIDELLTVPCPSIPSPYLWLFARARLTERVKPEEPAFHCQTC